MPRPINVTVGPSNADFTGDTHRALQAAVDYVAALGGGAVQVQPGTYRMGNCVWLRSNVRLVGSGDSSVLAKSPARVTPLTDDTDWFHSHATVEDPSCFEVVGGIFLHAKHNSGGHPIYTRHTVVAIDGNTVQLDSQTRENMWITHEAVASTHFPLVSGDHVHDVAIEDIALDGNGAANTHPAGRHADGIALDDSERVRVANVTVRDCCGDGISWQVCHDVTIESCRSEGNWLGLHPGSGSQRPIIRGNTLRDCDIGLFWCWTVQHGVAEHNEIRNSTDYGISIGHRDTDNVMRHNRVFDSGKVALRFRPDEPTVRCAHRNLVEDNLFQGAGTADAPGVGIDLAGAVDEVVLRRNRVVNPPNGHIATGLRIGKDVTRLTLDANAFESVPCEVEDLRAVQRS